MRLSILPAALALVAAAAPARAQSATLPGDTLAAVDAVFARFTAETPGCAVGVARDGREILARGYGLAELEHRVPVRPATIFEAGSVSKQFTAFAVLLLEQEGKLSLDDPMRKYLPELPEYGAPLTIRQVLSHTSGLRDWYSIAEVQGLLPGEHNFRNTDLLEMAARQRALNFASGTEYLYSNTGWNIMAILIERVAGEPFQEFSRRRIFQPLGMTSTHWRDDFREVVAGRAPAYGPVRRGGDTTYQHQGPVTSIVGAGGLLTTVHDLLRWNENLTSGRVGGRALVAQLATPARLADGRPISYGLGLRLDDTRGTPEVGHGGSTGGYRAQVVRYPERALSVAVLCNVSDAGAATLANGVADVFLGKAPVRQAGTQLSASELRAMAGLYRNTRTHVPVSVTAQALRRGGHAVLRRDGSVVTALLDVGADADSVVLARVAPWEPDVAALRAFEGEYFTDEAPATWRVAVEGDTLVLRGPPGRRIVLRPAYADVFTAPGIGHVRFHRDGAGKVVGAGFLMGRLREMRLPRL